MRRWTALAVLLVTACLAMPASAACPGCCAPGPGASAFACAVASGCGACDAFVRPAQSPASGSLVDVAAAQTPTVLPWIPAAFGAAALRRRPAATARASFPAISPLRL